MQGLDSSLISPREQMGLTSLLHTAYDLCKVCKQSRFNFNVTLVGEEITILGSECVEVFLRQSEPDRQRYVEGKIQALYLASQRAMLQ